MVDICIMWHGEAWRWRQAQACSVKERKERKKRKKYYDGVIYLVYSSISPAMVKMTKIMDLGTDGAKGGDEERPAASAKRNIMKITKMVGRKYQRTENENNENGVISAGQWRWLLRAADA